MTSEHRMTPRVEVDFRGRWLHAPQNAAAERRAQSVRAFDLRGSFANGQSLAGSGALVFEGEVLEGLRLN